MMRNLARAGAILAAFLLPLTAQSADAKPKHDDDRGGISSTRIDWD